jgi:hypothetical protein
VLLIVSAAAFGPHAVKGIGLGIGIAGSAMSLLFVAVLMHHRHFDGHPEIWFYGRALGLWSVLGGAMAAVTIWEIVGSAAFGANVGRWLTLANGLVIGALACAGLVLYEICTERVVHVLEVVERPPRELA